MEAIQDCNMKRDQPELIVFHADNANKLNLYFDLVCSIYADYKQQDKCRLFMQMLEFILSIFYEYAYQITKN